MGIKPATDIFQSRMVGIFQPMKENRPNPYIDNIFQGKGNDLKEHLTILDEILGHLEQAGLQVNLNKSNLCAKTVEFLGFPSHRQDTGQRANALKQSSRLQSPTTSKRSGDSSVQ
jgi:hypothetical protein